MKWCAAVALALTTALSAAQPVAPPSRTPKLIVLLMVDQFRGDYVERFQHQWTGGLHRLIAEGAWFRQARYPYNNTKTCPGHASVSTGSLPAVHGIVLNTWWDRTAKSSITCSQDSHARTLSYGRAVTTIGDSAAQLRTTTLADELQAQLNPAARVIAFSMKADAAAMLAGHRPAAVTWFDVSGTWVTSTAFTPAVIPEVAEFIKQNPVERDIAKTWDRALPTDAYLFENPAIGTKPKSGMTPSFPHDLSRSGADAVFYERWQSSPYADEYLANMALDTAKRIGLGTGRAPTDMIAVSFSALDKVGHDYGPNSHEVQDVLIRLDRTLGDLFSGLDRLVGAGNYTVALTADHGVSPFPERARQFGADAGRIDPQIMIETVERAAVSALGPGHYVSSLSLTDVYFEAGVYGKLRAQPSALESVRAAIASVPGVARVYSSDELVRNQFADDAAGRALARGYAPGRSGDLVFTLRPYWLIELQGTTHGTSYDYDTHVPVMLMGKGIAKGEYLTAVAPIDVAPTLAFLANVTLPQPSGRVLVEALRRADGSKP